MSDALVDRIDSLLPQTQCGRCGYERCRPYAQALASGEAAINRCPPGGQATIEILGQLLSRPTLPLDLQCGVERPLELAWIDEAACIGCTLCIQACPVDAIIGAAKLMHAVAAPLCTGCERCLAPCPVDCITMRAPAPSRRWCRADAEAARERMIARDERLQRERSQTEQRLSERGTEGSDEQVEVDLSDPAAAAAPGRINALVARAIARARQRRADRST